MGTSRARGGRADVDAAHYYQLAWQTFKHLLPHLPPDEKIGAGCFFSLTDGRGRPYFIFELGASPVEKIDGRFERALDKPRCAAQAGHDTSRSLKSKAREPYTGSLWGDLTARHGGTAGLPGDFDEMLVADVLVVAGDLSPDRALQYMKHNETFAQLRHLFNWAQPQLV